MKQGVQARGIARSYQAGRRHVRNLVAELREQEAVKKAERIAAAQKGEK